MANAKYTIMATASTILTDETDASYLSGSLNVINSSRNQIYYTGQSNPFSPDWSKYNLVIRPYLIATEVKKNSDTGPYNPDLFDPFEYNTFENNGYDRPIISNIHWFMKDMAGIETEITSTDERFSFSWTYKKDDKTVVCNDARQLVIRNNILKSNSSAEIICKFSYYDPYAKIIIPQQFNISIVNLATGEGTSKAVIEALNGNSIYNGTPSYLELEAHYYRDGIEIDLQEELEDATSSTNIKWYIRDIHNGGWKYLDSVSQETANNTTDNDGNNYDVCRKNYTNIETNEYTSEITTNAKGGVILRIFPDLISGSDSIKLVVTDGNQNNASFNDLMVVYDNTDETKAYIHLSNGNKLRRSMDNLGTTAKVVITYKGELLGDSSVLYENTFDYYWYKYNFETGIYYNIWQDVDSNTLKYKEISTTLGDVNDPIKSSRSIYITPNDINKEEEIIIHIVEKPKEQAVQAKAALLNDILISEDELIKAKVLNEELGIIDDYESQLFTAYELKANRNK